MSIVIGTGRWVRRRARSIVASAVSAAPSRRPSAAATPRLVVPTASKPAAASAAADAWSHAFGRTSGSPGRCRSANAVIVSPSTSARACASPGQRREPAPKGRPERSTRTVSTVGADATGDGHGHIFPAHEPGRRLARLDEDRDPRGHDLLVAARQEGEERGERLVRAGMGGMRLVGRGDDARGGDRRGEIARAEAPREHGDGEIRRRDAERRRVDGGATRARASAGRAPSWARGAPLRAAPPGRARRAATRRARGGGCGSRRWRSGRRSRAATPSCRTGRVGRGRGRERRGPCRRAYGGDVSVRAEASRA